MKKSLLSILGVSLLLLGSCSQETTLENTPSRGKAQLTIEIESLAREGGEATRGAMTRGADNVPSVAGENSVTSLYLLFFDAASGAYVDYTEVELPGPMPIDPDDETAGTYSPTTMNIDGVAFPNDKVDGSYNVLALANVSDNYFVEGSFDEWISRYAGGSNESEFMAYAMGVLPETITSNAIPMYGKMEKVAEEDQLHLMLSRIVSRLDVTNAATAYHKLVSATIWNGFPETMIWGDAIPDFSENTERVRRHYGVTVDGENIRGGLYAFENQVGRPEDHDKFSTCLIIGMEPTGGGATEYFRANLYDQTGRQNLRRNYVYNLIIDAVTGPGAPTEEIAYLGESNSLVYHILDWNEDQNGLIVRDDFSSLSIPTKTVNLGGTPAVAEFKIHTFSTLPSPSPLQIRSQTWRPAAVEGGYADHGGSPIWAELDGNTLVINATKLNLDETERRGVIVLSFAGLEIAMNVSQSGTHDDFLIVTEPDGGILPFAAYQGISSGLINVQASGHWTATLYMDGFSFDGGTATGAVETMGTDPAKNNNLNLIIPDETNSTIDKFRVFTHSSNATNAVREAFIVVELDGKEEQYSSVVMLSQNFIKALKYARASAPNAWMESGGEVSFDGTGNISSGSDAKWFVQTPQEGGNFQPWSVEIISTGTTDDTEYFAIDDQSHHDTEQPNNHVTVKATGMNISGKAYVAMLRVYLTNDRGTFSDIRLVQSSAGFDFKPGDRLENRVKYQGGLSDAITMDAQGGDMKWKIADADDLAIEQDAIGNHTRSLARYGEARDRDGDPLTLVLVDEDGDPTSETFEFGKEYDMDTGFRVKFPKLYFPNRDIDVTAAVTVTVNSEGATEGGMRQTVRAEQEALVAKKYAAAKYDNNDYGNLGGDASSHYFGEFRRAISQLLNTAESNPIPVNVNVSDPLNTVNGSYYMNFMYRTNYGFGTVGTTWNNAKNYIEGTKGHDGVYMITATYNSTRDLTATDSPMSGWTIDGGDLTATPRVNNDINDTKIYQFIMERTLYDDLTRDNVGIFENTGEVTNVRIPSLKENDVPIINGGSDLTECVLVINPKKRFIYLGDTEIFAGYVYSYTMGSTNSMPQNQRYFMRNLISYIGYTMRYGGGFSDLLIDDESAEGGGMPAPWDDWWGDNALERFDDTWPNLNY